MKSKKNIFLLLIFFAIAAKLYAQTLFPAGDYWSLDAGIGMSDILVEGASGQFILVPKLWLSPQFMIGSKFGINYSTDEILTFETQAFFRWNFLRLQSRRTVNTTNIFVQGGIGLLAAYRGENSPFSDVTMTRGSLLFDAAAGITIPLTSRWHIEPSIRGGYPHIAGFSITAGYKFPFPRRTVNQAPQNWNVRQGLETQQGWGEAPQRVEYLEAIRSLPPNEILRRTMISAVEFILFGPDIGEYNAGIDHDAQSLNELVLNHTAQILKDNADLLVRIEGHANPVTDDPNEADELMALSSKRANAVADQLRARGIREEQKVIISFGGTRIITSDHDIWNRNRRVELILIQVDTN